MNSMSPFGLLWFTCIFKTQHGYELTFQFLSALLPFCSCFAPLGDHITASQLLKIMVCWIDDHSFDLYNYCEWIILDHIGSWSFLFDAESLGLRTYLPHGRPMPRCWDARLEIKTTKGIQMVKTWSESSAEWPKCTSVTYQDVDID